MKMLISRQLPVVLAVVAMTFYCACAQQTKDKPGETSQTAEYADIDVATFDKLRQEEGYIILDVRTPEECAEGMVDDAIEMDFYADDFEKNLKKLDPNSKYLVYCRSGGRSAQTAEKMIELGFKDVSNLEGGYTKWSEIHE